MSEFQTLIMSRDSPLNIQFVILVVFIGATMSMPELTNGFVENVSCTNKTRKIFLLVMYVAILKITIFLWIVLLAHPGHISLLFETVKINFGGAKGLRGQGPRVDIQDWRLKAEKNKNPL